MFAHIPTNLNFLFKYGKPEKGLRKSVNKKLPFIQQYIQRYVLFYTGINWHLPYGMEFEFEMKYDGILTSKERKELGDLLADIAYEFVKKYDKNTLVNFGNKLNGLV